MKRRLYRLNLLLGLLFVVFCFGVSQKNSFATSININVVSKVLTDVKSVDSNGAFSSSEASSITVSTDNYTGYTLGIKAGSSGINNNALINTADSSKYIPSIAPGSSITPTNYANDSYASANNLNNTWGYLPSFFNSSVNTNYISAPTDTVNGDILNETHCANGSTGCPNDTDSYTITLGTRVNVNQEPGVYNNTFIIIAVANGTPYTVSYNKNAGSNTVSNMPSNVTNGVSYADTINLSTTTPTRAGYSFAGWCTSNASQTSCNSTLYNQSNGNLASFPIDRTAASNNITVYAIWTPNKYNITIKTATGISSVSLNGTSCSSTSGCVVQNLSYGVSYTLVATLSTGYSFSSWSAGSYGTIANGTSGSTTYTVGLGASTITPTATAISYTQTVKYYYQTTAGDAGSVKTYTKDVAYGSNFTFTSANASNFSSTTHSTTMYTTNTGNTTKTVNYTVTGEATNTVYFHRNTRTVSLTKGTGISAVTVTGGGVKSGSGTASATVYYGGTVTIDASLQSGYEWVNWTGSSTYENQSQSVSDVTSNLSFTANGVVVVDYCTTNGISNANCMQKMTSSNCTTTRRNVTDSRDGQTYGVTRLADGNCWMTKNLNLAGGTMVFPINTNTNHTYTLPASTSVSNYSNLHNSGSTNCEGSNPCYSYYSSKVTGAGYAWSDLHGDICPKGWKLPSQGVLYGLRNYYTTGAALSAAPFYSVYSGRIDGNTIKSGDYGYYWTSSYDERSGDRMYITVNSSGMGWGFAPIPGVPIRCMLIE